MTMQLTDEQEMLRDSVARFLNKEYDFAKRDKIVFGEGSVQAMLWQQMAGLGWIGACLPEEAGGFGGPFEAAAIMQEFGRRLVVEPLLESAIIGGQLLAAMEETKAAEYFEKLIEGSLQIALATAERSSGHDLTRIETRAMPVDSGWMLSGTKKVVANGDRADLIFVTALTNGSAGTSLFAVSSECVGLSRQAYRLHDGRGSADIVLDKCVVDHGALVGEKGHGIAIVEQAYDHAGAALCNEAVGSCDHVLAATIEYLKTRVQYDAPLARLQVLQHRVAEMFVATEQARVMARFATEALALPSQERARRVSAARVAISDYAGFVRKQAVQLHGGMGVSEELDIAHHLKRDMVAGLSHGDAAWHLERYMRLGDAAN